MWLPVILILAASCRAAQSPEQAQVVLACAPLAGPAVPVKLVVTACGELPVGASVRVAFTPMAGGPVLELPAPGPRTLVRPLGAAGQAPADLAVVDLGEVSLAPPCPAEVLVTGGLADREPGPLGTLRRGPEGAPAAFERAYPWDGGESLASGREARLLMVAAHEPLEGGQFLVRLACLNCGEAFAQDQDIFLHFELSPTGSDLAATTALGLYPAGRSTDSAAWSPGDLVVAQFGPYAVPDTMPGLVYLRAGLYNRQGDGARVPVAGPDDTSRALLGRLVTREGRTWFERAPLPGTQVPAGWEPAPEVGDR
jgi:hypothetical protein